MTAGIVTGKVIAILNGSPVSIGALTAGAVKAGAVRAQNVSAELVEKANLVHYPAVQVYCEKLVNDLREKFRSFSGTAQMAIEIRHSQDRLEGLTFTGNHGLAVGQGLASDSEIRFVAAIVDAHTVQLNAPFTVTPGALTPTVTYVPATSLPSVSVFDYWSPSTAVQRLLCGAAVDQMTVLVNGDYHEVHFKGLAQDVLDSSSFSGGAGALSSFPPEPVLGAFDFSVVPGNLGQAWLGTSPTQFFTVTSASLVVKNALETRSKEFGSSVPRAICPGQRSVTAALDLYSSDDSATTALYQAARQRSPITAMFQLGEQSGQMMAVYLKSVVPEVPEFDDSEQRLQWKFRPSRAQGTVDDEVVVAFG
jgi:hypothetical protein